jgi:hypothetical protein
MDSTPSTLDAEGQQLRALAEKADLGETTPEPAVTTPETDKQEDSTNTNQQRAADAEPKTEATKSDSPEASADRDEKGRFKPKAQETPYDKAKKEQERQKSVLANFEAEKKRERDAIAKERQELRQMHQQLLAQQQQQRQPQQQGPRFNSEQLMAGSESLEEEAIKLYDEGKRQLANGDIDGEKTIDRANKQLALSRQARKSAQEAYFQEQQQQYQGQYQQHAKAWRDTASAVIREHPELADESTDTAQKMQQLLQAEPIFGEIPDGFKKAYDYLQMHMAAEASGLKDKEIASLKQQLKELQERTGLSGSGPTPRSDRNIEDMPLEEQGNALRRQLEADRLAYA